MTGYEPVLARKLSRVINYNRRPLMEMKKGSCCVYNTKNLDGNILYMFDHGAL